MFIYSFSITVFNANFNYVNYTLYSENVVTVMIVVHFDVIHFQISWWVFNFFLLPVSAEHLGND